MQHFDPCKTTNAAVLPVLWQNGSSKLKEAVSERGMRVLP